MMENLRGKGTITGLREQNAQKNEKKQTSLKNSRNKQYNNERRSLQYTLSHILDYTDFFTTHS